VWRTELGLTTAFDDVKQTITLTDVLGTNQVEISVVTGTVTVKGTRARSCSTLRLVQEGKPVRRSPRGGSAINCSPISRRSSRCSTHHTHPGETRGRRVAGHAG